MKSFRYELRSSGHLEELASSRLPDGIASTDAKPSQHRDIFLDTSDDTLRRRDIVCRFRIGADDSRTLSLRIGGGDNGSEVRVDSPVKAADATAAAEENTEAGRNVEKATDSGRVKGEELLESEELKKKLADAKKRINSTSEGRAD